MNKQNTYDKIEITNERISKIRDNAINKVGELTKPKKIASFIELFLSILLSFGLTLITFQLDLTKIFTIEFWINSLCTLIAILLIFRATLNFTFDKVSQRENVIEAKEKYNELNSKKQLDMKEFLKEYNIKRRIEL